MNAKTKTLHKLIQEASFYEDCALLSHKDCDLQRMLESFSKGIQDVRADNQPEQDRGTASAYNPSEPNSRQNSAEECRQLQVPRERHLGDGSLDKKITSRISKASQSLGRLRHKVLNAYNIRLSIKLKVYYAMVLTSFIEGCESWTLYRRHIKQLETFRIRTVCSILRIRRQDRITNVEVLDHAMSISM